MLSSMLSASRLVSTNGQNLLDATDAYDPTQLPSPLNYGNWGTRTVEPMPVLTMAPAPQPVLMPAQPLPVAPSSGSSCGMAGRCTGYVPASPEATLPAIPAPGAGPRPPVAPSGAVMAQDAPRTVAPASGPVSGPSGAPSGFLGFLTLEGALPVLVIAAGVIILVQAMRESERQGRKESARAERARARAARNAS